MKTRTIIVIALAALLLGGCFGTKVYLGQRGELSEMVSLSETKPRGITPTDIPAGGVWGDVRAILNTNFSNIHADIGVVEDSIVAHTSRLSAHSSAIALRMLTSDTTAMLAKYARSSALAGKLNTSDTAAMLATYITSGIMNQGLASKINVSDTATMLGNYAKKSELSEGGISLGAASGVVMDSLNKYLPLYVRVADTASMLSRYITASTLNQALTAKVNVSDTASMLTNYAKKSELSQGGGMVYPGSGIAYSTGSGWGTSLSSTATGQNLLNLANPGSVSFIRINANNTIDTRSAANIRSDLSLENVTNESKATMFTNSALTGATTIATSIAPSTDNGASLGTSTRRWNSLYLNPGAYLYWGTNTSDGYIYYDAGFDDLYFVSDIDMGANSLFVEGSIGSTTRRVLKGWFTDLQVTNTITGTASAVTGYTRNSGSLTLSGGHGITLTTAGTTGVTLPTSGTLATVAQLNAKVEPDSITEINTNYYAAYNGADTLAPYIPDAYTDDPYDLFPEIHAFAGDTSNYATPDKIGDLFINTATSKVYVSVSTSRGGWVILNMILPLLLIVRRRRHK